LAVSEHDEGGGNWVWPFVLGLITGVLLMLGVGGVLVTNQLRQVAVERARADEAAARAAQEAARARDMEMQARREVEVARHAAEEALAQAEARLKAEKDKVDVEKKKPAKKD
jgi:hypothetical protein